MADVDISLAPIGKIVRMFKMLYIPNKKDYCIKFVSQNDILVKSLESGKTDGMLLFHAFEKLVFDYTWDWIAGYYNITMATMLLEPLLEVSAETFSLPMRDKIYQLISSCLGPKVGKKSTAFLDYNFYPATVGGRHSAVGNGELHTTALDLKVEQQDVAFASRKQSLTRKRSLAASVSGVLEDDVAIVMRYPKEAIASFGEYFSLAFSTIMTINFALLFHMKDPPSLVLAFLRDESPVRRRYYLQCTPVDTRGLDWDTHHHPLFCFVLGYLCTTWVKAFYHDNFGEAIGAKKGDTVRRSLLFAHEGVKATRKIRVLEAEKAATARASESNIPAASSTSIVDSSITEDYYYEEVIMEDEIAEQEIFDTYENEYYAGLLHDSSNTADASVLQEATMLDDNVL